MAKFLNTSAINYFLEEMIKGARDRLILISPFLKLNDRMKELLEDKNRLKINVRIVYGKSELQPDEIAWLRGLNYVRTSFCRNLHAKCYMSEQTGIITSLNLYEFSQVNNNEMGILIDRQDDAEIYKDAYEEAQRIIRISDEVRISLERVAGDRQKVGEARPSEGSQTEGEANASDDAGKLSTSKIAQRIGLKTQDFLEKAVALGFLRLDNGKHALTDKGIKAGAAFVEKSRFGPYFTWPDGFRLEERACPLADPSGRAA
jgi:hypothetical protein